MKRSIWTKTLRVALCIALILTVLFSGCTQPLLTPEECFGDNIAQVQCLITMTEELPLSDEAKSTIVAGWQEVIAQYEQGMCDEQIQDCDERIRDVVDVTKDYYTVEVCSDCPTVCDNICKCLEKKYGISYATCYYVCLVVKGLSEEE